MKDRIQAKSREAYREKKQSVSVSFSIRELEKVDRAASKRGFKSRSEFILSVLKRYF